MRNSSSAYLFTYKTRWKMASGFGSFGIFIDLFTYSCKLYQLPFSSTKLCLNLCAVMPDAIITSISDPNL